eukprot:jgi/Picre1/33392/NNA_008716.t1
MNRDTEQSTSQGVRRSKRSRTGTKKVAKLWTDFHQSCIHLERECRPSMIRFDRESRQVWCRVQCPYGKSCGYHGKPHIYERMCLNQPGDLDRRKLLQHIRNKHPEIALKFDVAVTDECHPRSLEDGAATIQLDRQVSTTLLPYDRDETLPIRSCEDFDEAVESSDEGSVCTEDLEDSDASSDEHEPNGENGPIERFRCTQGSHFQTFLMAVLGKERGEGLDQPQEDEDEEDEAPCTLLQLISALLEIELKHAVSKELMQDILSVVRMGRSNHDRMIIPPSIHLLRKAMDVCNSMSPVWFWTSFQSDTACCQHALASRCRQGAFNLHTQ